MRQVLSLAGLLVVLLIVMVVYSRQTRQNVDAVKTVSLALREEVVGRPFDEAAAGRLAERLRQLCDVADLPVEELREASATAAAWAAGSAADSRAFHTAVKLRAAAVELAGASSASDDPRRRRARALVDQAMGGSPGGPNGDIGRIRDQIQNLQTGRQEQLQDAERQTP
ncbi:MAG: hypothetical protein GW878_01160 [Acidobacteria bacterium]|nr:hypothetical protein [Acidobacteriota bacterium]